MRVCLVLGGASSVVSDYAEALALGRYDGAVIVNLLGREWPAALDAWVSLHGDKLKKPWRKGRENRGLPPHSRLIGMEDASHRFPGQTNAGSSGLFAVKVALDELGFERVVLCGVPLTPTAHFNDNKAWRPATDYRDGWREARPHIEASVRSMSGWTADFLGRPDAAWINGD